MSLRRAITALTANKTSRPLTVTPTTFFPIPRVGCSRSLTPLSLSFILRRPSFPAKLTSPFLTHNMSTSAVSRRLAGKTVLITGASSGIGRSTALEFARTAPQDLRIIVTARREERLHELAKQIRDEVGEGVKVLPVALDVSDPEQIKGFVERLPAEFREIDILVNNA